MDTNDLRKAYESVVVEVAAGGFGPPPAGEWDAGRIVGHLVLTDELLAAVTADVLRGPADAVGRAARNPGVVPPARPR